MSKEIHYTYSASAQPPEPTENDSLYSVPLAYPVGGGYYAAKAWQDGLSSTVTRTSFEQVSPFPQSSGVIANYHFDGNSNDSMELHNLTDYNITYTTGVLDNAWKNSGKGYSYTTKTFSFTSYKKCIAFWVTETSLGSGIYLSHKTNDAKDDFCCGAYSGNFLVSTLSGSTSFSIGSNWKSTELNLIVINYIAQGSYEVYLNNVKLSAGFINYWSATPGYFTLGCRWKGSFTSISNSELDELTIWDDVNLTEAEVDVLWNNGDGLKYT